MQVINLHLHLKCHSCTSVFQHFTSKKQLPGLSVSGTLVENGLKENALSNFMSNFFHINL